VPVEVLVPSVFVLLLNFSSMEKVLYGDCQARLKFDTDLSTMREQFHVLKEGLRASVKRKFKISPPNDPAAPQSG
jgi:hypothetical protein